MTRKDYVALAAALNDEVEAAYADSTRSGETAARTLCNVTVRVADVLAADNPRFDRSRFYDAVNGRFELL